MTSQPPYEGYEPVENNGNQPPTGGGNPAWGTPQPAQPNHQAPEYQTPAYQMPGQPNPGQPNPGYAAYPPGYGAAGLTPPNNNLVWAILSTVLCCLPLGIASIVFSTQVNSKWAMGDVAGAQLAAQRSRQFAIASAVVTVVGGALYGLFVLVAAGSGSGGY